MDLPGGGLAMSSEVVRWAMLMGGGDGGKISSSSLDELGEMGGLVLASGFWCNILRCFTQILIARHLKINFASGDGIEIIDVFIVEGPSSSHPNLMGHRLHLQRVRRRSWLVVRLP